MWLIFDELICVLNVEIHSKVLTYHWKFNKMMKVKTKQKLLLLFVLYTDLEYLRYTWGIEVSGKWQENYSIPDFVTLRRILTSSLCDLEVEVGYPRTGVLWGRSWLRWTVWPTCLLESLGSLSSCRPSRRRRWGSRSPESDRTPLKQFQMIGTMKYICSRPSSIQYRNQQECQECGRKSSCI